MTITTTIGYVLAGLLAAGIIFIGARFLVDNHADFFADCTEGISEVGGFSITLGGQRLYPVQTAEKGMSWFKLTAHGTAGHGSYNFEFSHYEAAPALLQQKLHAAYRPEAQAD